MHKIYILYKYSDTISHIIYFTHQDAIEAYNKEILNSPNNTILFLDSQLKGLHQDQQLSLRFGMITNGIYREVSTNGIYNPLIDIA